MQIVTTNPNMIEDAPELVGGPDGLLETQANVKDRLRASFLDRPLASFLRLNWETAIWIAILVVGAIGTICDARRVRAMSHDESLHSLYAYYLYANGNYDHNPMMHGPFRYHLTAFIYFLFGDSDFTARMAPALFGMGVIGMMYMLAYVHWGAGGHLCRYHGHHQPEPAVPQPLHPRRHLYGVLYAGLDLWGVSATWTSARCATWSIMVAGMAFGFATMENHFIHGAIIGAFFVGLALWQVAGPLGGW